MIPDTFREDTQKILDCFSGADDGKSFVQLCIFLDVCEKQGNDVPFLRQMAKLIRYVEDGSWVNKKA